MSEESEREHLARVKDLSERMKHDMHDLLTKYGEGCAKLARNSVDPHTPVVSTMQLAFATAAAEFLVLCGVEANQAAHVTLVTTGQAMETWARALMKHAKAEEAKNKKTVLHMPHAPLNKKKQ